MEEIVAPGPGSIRIAIEEGDDWLPAEVSLYFDEVEPQEGTDTIAVLDLDAMEFSAEHEKVMQRIQIELTEGDLIALREKITSVVGERPRTAIEAMTGVPLEDLL